MTKVRIRRIIGAEVAEMGARTADKKPKVDDREILAYIVEHTRDEGFAPTQAEIAREFMLTKWRIGMAIKRLKAKGLLKTVLGTHRTSIVNEEKIRTGLGGRFFVPGWLLRTMYRRIPECDEKDVIRLYLADLGLEVDGRGRQD